MGKHEFGIMPIAPPKGKRYEEYEPEKYSCISVDDDYIEDIAANFKDTDFYWHTLDVKRKGIAYSGVTLIPPDSIKSFSNAIEGNSDLSELVELAEKAGRESKWMIHFGL